MTRRGTSGGVSCLTAFATRNEVGQRLLSSKGTDNGSWYEAFDFRDACRELGLTHVRTRPYAEDELQGRTILFKPRYANVLTPRHIPTQIKDEGRLSHFESAGRES